LTAAALAALITPALALAVSNFADPVSAGEVGNRIPYLVAYVLLALVFSFLCSISEAALLSLTPSFIENLKERRPRLGRRLQRLKVEDVDRSLAAILTLNTIAHTVGAIGAGAEAMAVFGNPYFGVFSALMTLMILVLSEIVPKTIGAVYWRGLAGFTAVFVQMLIWLLYPFILVSERITGWIARGRPTHIFSREEMAAMASLGERAGALQPDESRIIRNLMRMDELRARDIMTPRTVIEALPEEIDVAEAVKITSDRPFSRLPLYRGDLDCITGFVLKDEIMRRNAEGRDELPLRELRREIPSVPSTLPLRQLLKVLLERREANIALVVDEYGGTAGLATLEDAVETVLGLEIIDEMDENEDMQALARRRWADRARARGLPVDMIDT